MMRKVRHAGSDVVAFIAGIGMVVVVLIWFAWNSWTNLANDNLIDATAPPPAAHGH